MAEFTPLLQISELANFALREIRRRARIEPCQISVAQYQARFATRIVAVVSVYVRAANSHRFDFHLAVKPPSIMMVCPVM